MQWSVGGCVILRRFVIISKNARDEFEPLMRNKGTTIEKEMCATHCEVGWSLNVCLQSNDRIHRQSSTSNRTNAFNVHKILSISDQTPYKSPHWMTSILPLQSDARREITMAMQNKSDGWGASLCNLPLIDRPEEAGSEQQEAFLNNWSVLWLITAGVEDVSAAHPPIPCPPPAHIDIITRCSHTYTGWGWQTTHDVPDENNTCAEVTMYVKKPWICKRPSHPCFSSMSCPVLTTVSHGPLDTMTSYVLYPFRSSHRAQSVSRWLGGGYTSLIKILMHRWNTD